jgi:predicted HAD superfamily phosphohydrolase YqeG
LKNEVAGSFPLDPNIKAPFLPPISKDRHYTLVLDLDETLVHYDE